MSATKSLYEVLGLATNATAQQIRAAYKQFALQHHPDRNPGDRDAAARFHEVCAAYDILSDADKRAAYDAQRQSVRLPAAIVDPAAALIVGLVDTAATVADGHLQKAGRQGGFLRRFVTETLRSAASGARHIAAAEAKGVADRVRAPRRERS